MRRVWPAVEYSLWSCTIPTYRAGDTAPHTGEVMMTPSDLPKCLRKYADIITDVSDERKGYSGDDGYWVYLAEGFFNDFTETHCIHEDNPRECAKQLKHVITCPLKNCCSPESIQHAKHVLAPTTTPGV